MFVPCRPMRQGAHIAFSLLAPLAQLDRASGYEPGGRRFESCRARQASPAQAVTLIRYRQTGQKGPSGSMDRLDQLRERTYLNNVTTTTIEWYESAWKAFKTSQSDASARVASESLISKADLQHFVLHLRERGLKPVSCNTWVRALNAVCRWLYEQREILAPIKLAPQRFEKRLIRTHDEATLRIVLRYRPNTFAQPYPRAHLNAA
jgi:hypothetical protein